MKSTRFLTVIIQKSGLFTCRVPSFSFSLITSILFKAPLSFLVLTKNMLSPCDPFKEFQSDFPFPLDLKQHQITFGTSPSSWRILANVSVMSESVAEEKNLYPYNLYFPSGCLIATVSVPFATSDPPKYKKHIC